MPQLNPLVLKDRKATPVNHTFTPRDIVDRVGTVAESSGLPLGDNRVAVTLVRTPSNRYKPAVKFTFPVLATETINGVSMPKIVRTAYADLTFNFDASSNEAERNDIVGMVQSALDADKTLINDVIVKLQGVY
jgi:hypothetical protein